MAWSEFEKSIDRYLAEHEERRKFAEERNELAQRLLGKDDLYRRWHDLTDMDG